MAKPLFAAGLRIAAITERINFHTEPFPEPRIRHVHTFTLLLQGKLNMITRDGNTPITPGTLFYSPPKTILERIGRQGESIWILYIELFDIPQWDLLKRHPPMIEHYAYADEMYLLLRRMLDAHKEQQFTSLNHARAALLVELLRQETEGASALPEKQQRALSALAEEISLHPEAKWDTTQMSRKLHMSRATLSRLFQTEYGLPPKTFVIRQRIARAIELLTATNHTIEAITQMVGYESVATFSNSFRQQTGKRPGQFRAAHAGRGGG